MEFGTLTKEEIDSLFTPVNFGNVTKEEIDSLFNPVKTPQVGVPTSDTTASVKSTPARTYKSSTSKTSQKNNSIPTVSKTEPEEKKQTFGRSGYSPNELRDMERAANGRLEANLRRAKAKLENTSQLDKKREKTAQTNAQSNITKPTSKRLDKNEIKTILSSSNKLTDTAKQEIKGLEKQINDLSKTVSTGDVAVDEAANSMNAEKARELKQKISKIKSDGHASNENYVVSKDKYDALMEDTDLAKDIDTLTQIIYNPRKAGGIANANYMSENLTGKSVKDYYAYLTDKYGLSEKQLKDMALTRHSENKGDIQTNYKEDLNKYGEAHPIKGSAASLLGTLGSGVEGAYNVVAGALTGDNRNLSNVFNNTKQGLREGVEKNIDSNAGKVAYELGMGLADLGTGVATGNAPLLLAGNTANEAVQSAVERGTDTRKASLYGGASGVVDYITNTIGLDKAKSLAMNSVKSAGVKQFLAKNAIAGLGEAAENVVQDMAQTALDELINSENSEMRTEYANLIDNGMSAEDALKQTIIDKVKALGMSAGTGYLMGSAMQGIPTLANTVENEVAAKMLKKNSDKLWDDVNRIEQETNNQIPEIAEAAKNGDIVEPDGFIPTTYKNGNGVDPLTEKAITNLSNTEKNILNNGNNFRSFIEDVFTNKAHPDKYRRFYYGTVSDELANDLSNNLGIDAKGMDIVYDTNHIQHIFNEHGDDTHEALEGRIGVTVDTLADSGRVFDNPDTIEWLPGTNSDGDRVFQLTKRVDGVYYVATGYKDNKHQLMIDSFRIKKSPLKADYADTLSTSQSLRPEPNNKSGVTENNPLSKDSLSLDSNIPQVETTVNPQNAEEGKIRKTYSNTLTNANVISPDELTLNPQVRQDSRYTPHKNSIVMEQARKDIEKDGEKYLNDYVSGNVQAKQDVDADRIMCLLQDYDLSNYERDSLMRNLAENATEGGQFIQALAKYNNTEAKAMLDAVKVMNEEVNTWKASNKTTADKNEQIAKALSEIERTGTIDGGTDTDVTDIAENATKNKSKFDLQFFGKESEPKKVSQRLQRALNTLGEEQEKVKPEPPTTRELREQVFNTLNNAQVLGDFVDSRELETINKWLDGKDLTESETATVNDLEYITNMLNKNATVKELRDALNAKYATGLFGISSDTQSKVNKLFNYARKFDENSEDFVAAQAEAYRLLAEEVAPKANALEKFDTWRYMAMLGNPKTMLRNFIGNKLFSAVTGVSNNLAALGEAGVDKLTNGGIQRTKAVLNPVKDQALIKAAKEDARNKRFRQIEGSKYEKMDKDTLKQSRSVWNSNVMQLIEKAIDSGISDTNAVINKYATSLAGYMKANGLDQDTIRESNLFDTYNRKANSQLLSDSEKSQMEMFRDAATQMEKARDYALKQAEYATFHEDNAVANALTRASRYARSSDNAVVRGLGYGLEGVVPFKKTPANILKSGLQYSPLGAIDSIRNTGKLIYENTGKRKGNLEDTYTKKSKLTGREKEVNKTLAADVLDSWSKTLTGSGLTALGYYLFNKGILKSNDKDTKYQEQLEGVQNFSIEINGHTYTIDWSAPAAMPLFLGAEIAKVRHSLGQTDDEWYKNLDTYINTANSLLDPIFETSMLSGIQDTLETLSNATSENNIGGAVGTLLTNTLTGYASQAIPTLSGQIARTVDPVRRSTYAENEGVPGVLEKQGRKWANKIPVLSKVNSPYINQRGNVEYNGPFQYEEGEIGQNIAKGIGNFAYQTLSPGYIDKVEHTPADKIGWDVYNDLSEDNTHSKDTTIFSKYRGSGNKLDGKKLTKEQQTTYELNAYRADDEIRNGLAADKWFNSLSSSVKGDILKDVNSLVGKIGQASIDEKYQTDDKAYNAYKDGGIPAFISYEQDKHGLDNLKQAYSDAGVVNSDGNAYTSKSAQDAYETGKIKEYGEYRKWQQKSGQRDSVDLWHSFQSGDIPQLEDTGSVDKTIDWSQYGLESGNSHKNMTTSYSQALQYMTSLAPEAFAKQWKAIDADNSGTMKKQEIIDYLNSVHANQSTGDKIFNAYKGGSKWKAPVLKNGKWVAE